MTILLDIDGVLVTTPSWTQTEILADGFIDEWVKQFGQNENYVIIDDDLSLGSLTTEVKERWVSTKPLIGFDKDAKEKALTILQKNETIE
jgi:hypothetical protein